MKLNYQIFSKLTRDADIVDNIEETPYKIYFATEEEKVKIFRNDAFSILSSDGNEIKLLVDKEAYEFEQNKEYFGPQLTKLRMDLISDVSKRQKITLFAIMLPITVLFLIATSLLLAFKSRFKNPSVATVILVVLVILVFIASFLINMFSRKKIEKKHMEMQEKTIELLGKEKANELLISINKFNEVAEQKRKAIEDEKKLKKAKKDNEDTESSSQENQA